MLKLTPEITATLFVNLHFKPMKKQKNRNYPDALHEAMDIPEYQKQPVDDGVNPPLKKKKEKKNKHERSETKSFERKEKRLGSE